jgi:hypothetical protein
MGDFLLLKYYRGDIETQFSHSVVKLLTRRKTFILVKSSAVQRPQGTRAKFERFINNSLDEFRVEDQESNSLIWCWNTLSVN